MKKILFVSAVLSIILSIAGNTFADVRKTSKKKPVQVSVLAKLLPASDGIVTINLKNLLNVALPQVVKTPKDLEEINNELNSFKERFGFDLRSFEEVAAGINIKKVKNGEYDFEPFILGNGNFNSAELIELAKTFSKGQYREETIEGKTVYIFSAREILKENQGVTKNSKLKKMLSQLTTKIPAELALTSYNNNTLAMGTPTRMKEVLENSTSKMSPEMLNLVSRKVNSVVAFAGNLPPGMITDFIGLDTDEIGQMFASIRQISGFLSTSKGLVSVSLFAKTEKVEQAVKIEETLQGLQAVGKALLGGGKTADKQVYERMIDNVKIARNLSEVNLDLAVANSDLEILIK